MHRSHHARCERLATAEWVGNGDPHSPDTERGFWFAHGGFLYDRFEHYEFKVNVPDLSSDADLVWFSDRKLYFLLLPLLAAYLLAVYRYLRPAPSPSPSPADAPSRASDDTTRTSAGERPRWRLLGALRYGVTRIVFLYYLPVLMTWHNSMLINSGVHRWGYELYADAMSPSCVGAFGSEPDPFLDSPDEGSALRTRPLH